jgi:glucokinase
MTNDVVAVDLGGTNIRAARVDSTGKVLARDKVPTHAKQGGMSAVAERIANLVKGVKGPHTKAVGVGTPGVPDPKTGVMTLQAVNIPGSAGFPLTRTISSLVNLPVFADNDGNLAALGESWLGAGMGEPVVIIFTLGTGIGGGLVVDGKVYHGAQNLVTEFGHVSIDHNGRKCGCGGTGCVELYASASAVGRDAREALRYPPGHFPESSILKECGGAEHIDKVDARMVWEAAKAGDPLACFLADRACVWLGTAIGAMVNAFNPSCVIIGGGMSLSGDPLRSRVEKVLNEGRAFAPIWKCAKLRLAVLGDDAGLMGSARMAFQNIS